MTPAKNSLTTGFLSLLLGLTMPSVSACKAKPSSDALQAFPAEDAARIADAIMADDATSTTALIHGGANASANGDAGRSLLEFSIMNDKPKAFGALLAGGADITHVDAQGDTALHYAAKAEDPAYVNALLVKKADPNIVNKQTGDSPLMDAALTGREQQLRALIQAGAKLDFTEPNGDTALIMAAQSNKTQIALDLLAAGADPTTKNKIGATFKHYLNITPMNVVAPETQREREKINRWLVGHNVPIES